MHKLFSILVVVSMFSTAASATVARVSRSLAMEARLRHQMEEQLRLSSDTKRRMLLHMSRTSTDDMLYLIRKHKRSSNKELQQAQQQLKEQEEQKALLESRLSRAKLQLRRSKEQLHLQDRARQLKAQNIVGKIRATLEEVQSLRTDRQNIDLHLERILAETAPGVAASPQDLKGDRPKRPVLLYLFLSLAFAGLRMYIQYWLRDLECEAPCVAAHSDVSDIRKAKT